MKKYWYMYLIAILICTMTSCSIQYKGPYVFWHQERGNIKDVKIYSYDRDTQTTTALAEVAAEDVDSLLDTLSSMQCFRIMIPDGQNSYGLIHITVTYLDGAAEVIGLTKIGYVTSEGKETFPQYHFYDTEKFYNIICQYVNPELLPDMRQEYPGWYS